MCHEAGEVTTGFCTFSSPRSDALNLVVGRTFSKKAVKRHSALYFARRFSPHPVVRSPPAEVSRSGLLTVITSHKACSIFAL